MIVGAAQPLPSPKSVVLAPPPHPPIGKQETMKHIAIFLLILSAPAMGQMQQTIPAGHMTPLGGAGSSFPFNTAPDHTWQWHYDSAQLTATFPIIITEISVSGLNGVPLAAFSFPSVEISVASSPTDYTVLGNTTQAGHDPTLANNLNADLTVVRPAAPWVGGAAAWQWHPFGITTPFLYDPTLGNDLVVQIRKCGTTTTFGQSIHGSSGTAGLNGGNRYGDTVSCAATTTTFANNEYVPVIMIDYIPAGGLFAGFSWTGNQATQVITFTDQSYSSASTGILSWSWDFGDGNTSAQQSPLHSYACPGNYTVTLTVQDGINPAAISSQTVAINAQPFELSSAPGTGDLLITPPISSCYPSVTGGFTVYTLTTVLGSIGNGPMFGITPDGNTWAGITGPRLVGSPLNFFTSPGIYPDAPLYLGPGTLAAWIGQTVDAFVLYQNAAGGLVHWSNVAQVTF